MSERTIALMHRGSAAPRARAPGLVALMTVACAQAPQTSVASGTVASTTPTRVENGAIRPFQVHATDEALADPLRRIAATKWPSPELVADGTQGVQFATMRELARYWHTDYDGRSP